MRQGIVEERVLLLCLRQGPGRCRGETGIACWRVQMVVLRVKKCSKSRIADRMMGCRTEFFREIEKCYRFALQVAM